MHERLPALLLVIVLHAASERVAASETPRQSVIKAMVLRPNDPWPRGRGHVVLAVPGSREEFKAYHEPGGGFSPAFGSLGVSFWVTDAQNRRLTTSDALPLTVVTQRLVWPEKPIWPKQPDVPGIETRTPYYDLTWSAGDPGQWKLKVRAKGTNVVWLVIRSVGPAGAPMKSLHWLGQRLYVNDRWTLSFAGRPAETEVVPPGPGDPAQSQPRPAVSWPAEKQWGYARFRLLPNQETWVILDDARTAPPSPLRFSRSRSATKLELPDDRFAACLDAQVAHLLMGLVDNETRPGDPNNYPLNWLRDGAYAIVALARTGQLDVARELCLPFAEQDFFGGFGSEADAPGLALWALEEVAVRLGDRGFDSGLWPHVRRKAGLIREMLSASGPVRKAYAGPLVPAHADRPDLDLVCDAARRGLIIGRMDWHRPVLYVNALSYRGLISAARWAERLGREEEAGTWRQEAAGLRAAWAQGFNTEEAENERTFICGLHPSWIVTDREAYRARLQARRQQSHDAEDQLAGRPLWTYFNLAEAHQWLLLGQPERAWNDWRWFLAHQASPGLYTWWEGEGEENTFHRWDHVRGWVTPPHVTPHYWTAAEMALLQLDMLAYVDESGSQPRLVVGAGVPREWLDHPLRVEGLSTRLGWVDWQWRKGRLTVKLHGRAVEVTPGPAFPAGLALKVKD